MNSQSRKWLFKFLMFCILLAGLVLLDFIFGWFFQPYGTYLNKQQYGLESYSTNPRGYFDHVQVNGQMFYTIDRRTEKNRAHEFTEFESDSLKILAIGDSFTFAQGVKLNDTYIKKLESLNTLPKTYGLNISDVGANIKMAYNQLEAFYATRPQVKPRVVIYGYVLNDPIVTRSSQNIQPLDYNAEAVDAKFDLGLANDFINTRVPVIKSLRSDLFKFLGEHSNILDFGISILERNEISGRTIAYYQDIHDVNKNGQGLAETAEIFRKMNQLAEGNGARFLVLIFPLLYEINGDYPFFETHEYLKKMLNDSKIESIDLQPVFSKYSDEELWVHAVDQHPNELAQALTAEEIQYWLMKEQYVDLSNIKN